MTASDSDRAEIARQVQAASTSFYGAMRVLDKARREAIFAIYAFCRAVDDIADDAGMAASERTERLDTWRQHIRALYAGRPGDVVTRALAEPVATYALHQDDFMAIIDGMQMDADGPIVAPPSEVLELYCDRVACAVGRLCVNVFGEPGPHGEAVARHLGCALQLTNILRDVEEDARIGRLYLPCELLRGHGIDYSDPAVVMSQPGFAAAWRALARQAEAAFEAAETGLGKCDRRKTRPARIMLEVYRRNLRRMMALSDDALSNPAVSKRLVGKPEKLFIALRHAIF